MQRSRVWFVPARASCPLSQFRPSSATGRVLKACAYRIVRLGWRLQPSGAYTSARIGHGIAVICCTPGVANHEHIWFRESFVNLHSAKLQPTESYRPQLKVAGKRENVMRADERVRLILYVALFATDILADFLGFLVANYLRHGTNLSSADLTRSEEHTSELRSLMRYSYAVFCLKTKNRHNKI